jgi:hypothetical protein
MAMGPGVFGSRGDVDIQRDVFHPVKTTWQQTVRLALAWTIGYLCLIVILSLIILAWLGFDWWWWLIRYLAEWLLIPPVVAFGYAFVRAAILYYAVVQKQPRWPPPMAQVNPLEVGFGSAYRFPVYEPEHEERVVVQFEGSIHNGNGQSKHHRLNTEYPNEWQRFARHLTADMKILRYRFSFRAARRCGVPEDEFDNLQKAWERIGFTERTSQAQNAHYKLTDWGFEWMRGFAATPLP